MVKNDTFLASKCLAIVHYGFSDNFFFLSYYLDRRDSLKRAANISLVDVAEADEGEIREMVVT